MTKPHYRLHCRLERDANRFDWYVMIRISRSVLGVGWLQVPWMRSSARQAIWDIPT